MSIMDDFYEKSPFYPGSKQRRDEARQLPAREQDNPFPYKGRIYSVKGQDVEFFTCGQLAAALDREAVTIRRWEAIGILPKATFQAPNPKKVATARRRLYSRAQAEGIVRIAREEGLLEPNKRPAIIQTHFTERVVALFKELQAK